MDIMYVVNFASTGHILGAVTRTAQPDTPPTIEQIAGSGVDVRYVHGEPLQTNISARELAITQVAFDSRVIYTPHLFALDGARVEQQDFAAAGPPIVSLTGELVTITLPSNVLSDTQVFVHVSGGALSEPLVRSETILANQATVANKPLRLGSGVYDVVIFAPGYGTVLQSESVP